VVMQQEWRIGAGSSSLAFDVSRLSKGFYLLELKGEKIMERIRFVKL
jgi:hypothetical protein